MLLNKPRAYEIMDKHGLDGLLAVNQVNIYYLTDYWGPLMRMRRTFSNYAVLPRNEAAPAALIATAVELSRLFETPDMTWVPNICAYTHPVFADKRDFDPNTEDPTASQEGFGWPVKPGDLAPVDLDYVKWIAQFKGRYSVNAAYALKKALKDAGLEKAKLGTDDPRVIAWLNGMGLPDLKGVEATTIFREIRMVKSEPEIEILRKAAAINEAAINATIASLRVGLPQTELEIIYNTEIAKRGGKAVYLSTGTNGKRKSAVQRDQLITFDGLCEYRHYHGDIGRSAVCGEPTPDVLKRAAAVKLGCDVAYGMIKPGVKGKDVTRAVVDAVTKAGFPGFFVATPHSVGLEHTDHPLPIGPQLPGSQGEFVFHENMVFTIDMPYYEVGWGNLHVEDTVRVTRTGVEPLNSCDVSLRVVPVDTPPADAVKAAE
ncbi:MAG: aminopeptidase P family protein [Rhodospirillaceae bacterium]|nr:aminopeptidase P family protein [Rhodospirillaceae bacterium]